jgi:hypothetical protein
VKGKFIRLLEVDMGECLHGLQVKNHYAHDCNSGYPGGRDQEDHGSSPAGWAFMRPHLNKKMWAWWHMLVIPGT